jgi:hypothetical protein
VSKNDKAPCFALKSMVCGERGTTPITDWWKVKEIKAIAHVEGITELRWLNYIVKQFAKAKLEVLLMKTVETFFIIPQVASIAHCTNVDTRASEAQLSTADNRDANL